MSTRPSVKDRLLAALTFAMVTMVPIGHVRAQGEADIAYIKALLDRERQLEKERQELVKLKETVATGELELKREDKEIKREHEQNRHQVKIGMQDAENQSKEAREFNAQCANRPLSPSEYARCAPWKSRLDAWEARAIGVVSALQRQYDALQQRQARLTEETLRWARQKKEADAKFADVEARRAEWVAEVRRLMLSPNLEDLKRRAGASAVCTGLETLEAAHHCLQRVWDGAR